MANVIRLKWTETSTKMIQFATRADNRNETLRVSGVSPDEKNPTSAIFQVEIPLQEDLQVNFESNFESLEEINPSFITGIVNTANSANSLVSGKTSSFSNIFKLKIWKETMPIQLNLKLAFSTETNGWGDVWIPAMSLASLCILGANEKIVGGESIIDPNSYKTPGLNLSNYSETKKQIGEVQNQANNTNPGTGTGGAPPKNQTGSKPDNTTTAAAGSADQEALDRQKSFKEKQSRSRLVDVVIPGIIRISDGIVEKTTVTFSKERTVSGAPFYAEMDFIITSSTPAVNTNVFAQGISDGISAQRASNQLQTTVRQFFT